MIDLDSITNENNEEHNEKWSFIPNHPYRMFIRCRKLNISLVFITQSYFSVPKDVRLNTTHYENTLFIMKINNKIELKNIAIDHSADITITILRKLAENVQQNLLIF